MERVTVDDVATLYPVGTLDPVGSHKIFSKALLKPFGTRRSHSVCIIHGNLQTTPHHIKEEGGSHDKSSFITKTSFSKKNNQTVLNFDTQHVVLQFLCTFCVWPLST